MRSKTRLALAIAGVIAAGGAIATAFEGRISCDQDPRFATAASCVVDGTNTNGPASPELSAIEPPQEIFTSEAVEASPEILASEAVEPPQEIFTSEDSTNRAA